VTGEALGQRLFRIGIREKIFHPLNPGLGGRLEAVEEIHLREEHC
jgi:hypothetical protein